jgi:calcium/calmodulin-dependent protein kinase I
MIGILKGVRHLHEQKIVHLDLKPENILVKRKVKPSELQSNDVQICDFGFGQLSVTVYKFVGTPGFFAPEMLANYRDKGGIDGRMADMFSLGASLAELSKETPEWWFQVYKDFWEACVMGRTEGVKEKFHQDMTSVLRKYRRGYARRHGSEGIRDLVGLLLSMNPTDRPTAQKALEHHWLTKKLEKTPPR